MTLPFDTPGALAINAARLEHLGGLGLPLARRTVIETGAGVGHLTGFWHERGCAVVSTEGRAENVAEFHRRHPGWPIVQADLNEPGSHDGLDAAEVVFCYGTLYHTADPARTIADLARRCSSLFLLESCVWTEDDGGPHPGREPLQPDQALDHRNCRPARDWLLAELGRHFEHAYLSATQPDHGDYPERWPVAGRMARAVFVASRAPLDVPGLLPAIPPRVVRGAVPGLLLGGLPVVLDPRSPRKSGSWHWSKFGGRFVAGEMDLLERLADFLRDRGAGAVLADVGANCGSYALLPLAVPGLAVHAFEPMPEAFDVLAANVAVNGLAGRVTCHNAALGDVAGTGVLRVPADCMAWGLATQGTPRRFKEWRDVAVTAARLDDMGLPRLDVLKVDTEGAELGVLRGAEATIARCRPAVQFEWQAKNAAQFGYAPEDIEALLRRWGYTNFERIGPEETWATA